ncbi:hypothetical protein ATANTOWER_029904 [Ataeniobius toweri]|uniref:Uncharacterized protein n=1 Tax=Ataeniobius toweri TaxID=208326 RepID=A0ABU7ATY7_9TELE|nr:hypothetical protein [Ataeniobius toweri]
MMGRTAIFGDLFGFLVSDLVPKSTRVLNLQLLTELRVEIQQQLAALVFKKERRTFILISDLHQNNSIQFSSVQFYLYSTSSQHVISRHFTKSFQSNHTDFK